MVKIRPAHQVIAQCVIHSLCTPSSGGLHCVNHVVMTSGRPLRPSFTTKLLPTWTMATSTSSQWPWMPDHHCNSVILVSTGSRPSFAGEQACPTHPSTQPRRRSRIEACPRTCVDIDWTGYSARSKMTKPSIEIGQSISPRLLIATAGSQFDQDGQEV
jgi:hypothetical protein